MEIILIAFPKKIFFGANVPFRTQNDASYLATLDLL